MLMRNPTDSVVLVRLMQGSSQAFTVEPGEVVEIADKFAMPRLAENGSRRPSVIEEIAPQLLPANEDDMEVWSKAPEAKSPQKPGSYLPSVQQLIDLGTPRGVAIKMVEQALASEADKLKAYKEAEVLKIKKHVKDPANKKIE